MQTPQLTGPKGLDEGVRTPWEQVLGNQVSQFSTLACPVHSSLRVSTTGLCSLMNVRQLPHLQIWSGYHHKTFSVMMTKIQTQELPHNHHLKEPTREGNNSKVGGHTKESVL